MPAPAIRDTYVQVEACSCKYIQCTACKTTGAQELPFTAAALCVCVCVCVCVKYAYMDRVSKSVCVCVCVCVLGVALT